MPGDRNPVRHQLKIYGPAALLVVAAFVLAYQFIKPAPPDHIVMASGPPDGAYHAFAQRYADYLAREGVTLELRTTAGSVENVDLLTRGQVSLAMVQGGVSAPQSAGLLSLGSMYYEPMWLFHRRDTALNYLSELAGRLVAIGPQGSGTRALVQRLLLDNGVDRSHWSDLGGSDAAHALRRGEVDAAFFVMGAHSELIDGLLRDPDLLPADFSRADAYTRRYPFLSGLVLPEGVVDLAANIPARPVRLLAPTANLVADPELHPALIDLLLQAATEVHREGGWFADPNEFPKAQLPAFPLSADAERFYRNGPPFLQRYLPFWAASLVDRLKVMLLPLLVLLLPLLKVMPPIYTWRMRARVYRWYDELESAEQGFDSGALQAGQVFDELQRIEREVQHVNVPLSFTDQLYHLRQHIELVRCKIRSAA